MPKAAEAAPASAPELVWYRDPRGFVRDDRIARILPEAGAPLAAQLNAIMRFALAYGAAALVMQRSATALYVPAAAALLTFLVYESEARAGRVEAMSVAAQAAPVPSARRRPRAGRPPCRRPTRDNPFMNVLVTELGGDPAAGEACDIVDDPAVAQQAEDAFSRNLYRDVDDVFNRRASSRAFYTAASTTVPNDQTGFAEWLYRPADGGSGRAPPATGGPGGSRTCKEGSGEACFARIHRVVPGV